MLLKDFYFEYPPELVAQEPAEPRDGSRLLKVNRRNSELSTHVFRDLPSFFQAGDVLVLNDTKVLPARLWAEDENQKRLEVLFTGAWPDAPQSWNCMIFPSRKIRLGSRLYFRQNSQRVEAEVVQAEGKVKTLRFEEGVSVKGLMLQQGAAPLPPYIKRQNPRAEDLHRYQSVFAKKEGAIAAPTASLHFTEKTFEELEAKGVEILYLTLHVGLGTFEPIRSENILEHQMQSEFYEISEEVVQKIRTAKAERRSITAVGTTVVRTLESYFSENEAYCQGHTQLYITPGYTFKIIDRFLTNFHQPESTPLLLTSAFAGIDLLKAAYQKAIQEKFRLFSYGDCMFIE